MMLKRIQGIQRICALLATCLLCSNTIAQTQYPLTITDGVGRQHTFNTAPTRISSKTLFTDEVLLSMLPPERLTSLTNFANDPSYSSLIGKIPDGLPLLGLSAEAIINNGPDLVFAANWSDAGVIAQLEQTGVAVYLLNTPFTIEAIQAEIMQIGLLLNAQDDAQSIIDEMNQQLAAFEPTKNRIENEQWVALDYNTWGTANGKDTTWQAVLDATGLTNGSAAYEQGKFGQVPMSKELIVAINPDVLFLPGWSATNDEAARAFYQQVANDPALAGVKAVQTGRVYAIPEPMRGTYSQYIIETIEFVLQVVNKDVP